MKSLYYWWSKLSIGMRRGTIGSFLLSGLFIFTTAHAQDDGIASAPQSDISSIGGIFCVIDDVFDILFWLLIAFSTVMIVVAAYKYLTSAGNSEKVSEATRTIIYAAVAVAVALLAREIPLIVGSFFGVSGLNASQCG